MDTNMVSIDELEIFFQNYAAASLGLEPAWIAALYADHFVTGGPRGSATFSNNGQFVHWLREVQTFNKRTGMTALELVSIEKPICLNDIHVLAQVEWGARFKKTGTRLIKFWIAYLLEKNDGRWKILAYISEKDQEDEMRKLGITES